jgi:regulator of protease activity HflC (stomatin/prohibitin superfamily)
MNSSASVGQKGSLAVFIPILVAAAVGIFAWFVGSANPYTPAGYVGYLTQGAVLGKAHFYGLQNGPTSPGRTWMLRVTNVSITPYTYNEEFSGSESVLSKDNLKIAFRVHVVWKVRPERVKDFVERYSTLSGQESADQLVEVAYKNFLREPLRTYARDEVQQLNGLEIKDQISPIGKRILERTQQLTAPTPFEVDSVVVGNIQYPAQVADAVSLKLAATQDLERKQIEIRQAEMEKKKRVVEAEGIAQAMEVINAKLTPSYLQHEAIQAQQSMVGSPNHTTIYIPVGPMGVPIVGTFDVNKSAGTDPQPQPQTQPKR